MVIPRSGLSRALLTVRAQRFSGSSSLMYPHRSFHNIQNFEQMAKPRLREARTQHLPSGELLNSQVFGHGEGACVIPKESTKVSFK